MYKRILLPTDGSVLSAKAIKQGLRFAKSIGAKVTIINIAPEYRDLMDEGLVGRAFLTPKRRYEDEAIKRSKTLLGGVKTDARAAGVECDCVSVISSVPYDAIIKQAKKAQCDLIMMASHGRNGLSSILLGSETAKVLSHSSIPVLVVR